MKSKAYALRSLAASLGVALLAACQSPSSAHPESEKVSARFGRAGPAPAAAEVFEPGSAENGRVLVEKFECHRCHAGTGLAAPPLARDCVGCHEQIATDQFRASSDKLAKWKPHVAPYRDVPSLTALGARLQPAWVRDYLLQPRDLRPHLAPTMPRLPLSREQARDIATYLTRSASVDAAPAAVAPVTAEPARLARGKQLLSERGCVGCHRVSGAGLPEPPSTEPAPRALALAPDLRFSRERSEPAMLVRWLLDPPRVKHDAVMPRLGLSADDAGDLAAFLSFGALEPPQAPAPFERLPVLKRRVGFDEVNQQVFAVTCRHCHTNPDLAGGDGGPGNTGGFGFAPRKIDLSSYPGIQSGGVDARGARVSLFIPTKEGVPRLVAALIARQREMRGQPSEEVRGMPLGLAPLSAQQIQLVESWVLQGRPL